MYTIESSPTNREIVESNIDSSIIFASTSIVLAKSTIIDEEEKEQLFHTLIWVQNIPLHIIMDNGSQKKFVSEDIVNKLSLINISPSQPYNIS